MGCALGSVFDLSLALHSTLAWSCVWKGRARTRGIARFGRSTVRRGRAVAAHRAAKPYLCGSCWLGLSCVPCVPFEAPKLNASKVNAENTSEMQRPQRLRRKLTKQCFRKDIPSTKYSRRVESQLQCRHLTQMLVAEKYTQVVSLQLPYPVLCRQCSSH
jgi:hypothetical protein